MLIRGASTNVKVEEPAPEWPVETWGRHPRLHRHAQRYLDHTDPGRLLSRYRDSASKMGSSELLRHICHVGSWVALLPRMNATQLFGTKGLSPVRVLAHLLRTRRRGPLNAWSRGILRLVALRMSTESLGQTTHSNKSKQWLELRRSMPRSVWKGVPATCLSSSSAKDARPLEDNQGTRLMGSFERDSSDTSARQKRLRLLQREVQRWKNLDFLARAARLKTLEGLLCTVGPGSDDDAWKLRAVLRGCVALLSPPCRKKAAQGLEPLDAFCAEQLRCAAVLQRRVHCVLIRAIRTWKSLWLETDQIEAMLMHIRFMIQRFEVNGQCVGQARGGNQWANLSEVLGVKTDNADRRDFKKVGKTIGSNRGCVKGSRKGWAGLIGRHWHPQEKIVALPHVRCSNEDAKVLRCRTCDEYIFSAWFFVHPKSGKSSVLVPQNGHAVCGGARFYVEDGSPHVEDKIHNIDFCVHLRKRVQCAPCGGRFICTHGKQRHACRTCRGEGRAAGTPLKS